MADVNGRQRVRRRNCTTTFLSRTQTIRCHMLVTVVHLRLKEEPANLSIQGLLSMQVSG